MTIYPALGPQKKTEELRSCEGCHLTVMARGDWSGWKGVDDGTGKLMWYCDKLPCRQLRDEYIARRSHELAADQLRQRAVVSQNTELEALRKRVGELESERVGVPRVNPSAPPVGLHSLSDIMATAQPRTGHGQPADAEALVAGDTTHIFNKAGTGSLCGAAGPTMQQAALTWEQVPCPNCVAKWQSIAEGREHDNSQPAPKPDPSLVLSVTAKSSDGTKTYLVTRDELGAWHCECEGYVHRKACRHINEASARYRPLTAPAVGTAADALYGEQPKPPPAPVIDSIPRFSPGLIASAAKSPDEYIGKTILVPPSAYPEMDLTILDPEQLRGGISALFAESGLVVDRIERARKAGQVVGLVFNLRRP
jgi:hypothetical protein